MQTINKFILLSGVILVICGWLLGCSGMAGDAIAPTDFLDPSYAAHDTNSQRMLWGIWDLYFDAYDYEAVIVPNRSLQAHFDITDMLLPPACDDCLGIKVNSFDPVTRNADVDVTLGNPSQITGYDVRGILYTNDYGHELCNPDDWTGLFDIPGGDAINPFKAFAKDEPGRSFAPDAEHAENYLVYIPKPPHYESITYAVTASWPGNCKEPYAIDDFAQLGVLYEYEGATAELEVCVRDWQDDTSKVTLVAPMIAGENFTQFSKESGDLWHLVLTNNTGASAGDYTVRIIASSINSAKPAPHP